MESAKKNKSAGIGGTIRGACQAIDARADCALLHGHIIRSQQPARQILGSGGEEVHGTTHRELCHDPEYAADCDALYAENPRYAEVICVLEELIARKAESHHLIPEAVTGVADIRTAPSNGVGGLAPIVITFTIENAIKCTLMAARKVLLPEA